MDKNYGAEERTIKFSAVDSLTALGELDIREFFLLLWRRKWLMFWIVFLSSLLTSVVVLLLTPRYTANVALYVEEQANDVFDLNAAVRGLPTDSALLGSQLEIITSRKLAASIIDRLNLMGDPEFNEELRPTTTVTKLKDSLSPMPWILAQFGQARSKPSADVSEALERERVIDTFLEDVAAEVVENTRVIQISFTSDSATKAAQLANTVAEGYINERLEAKYESVRRTTIWLNERVSVLRAEVEASERAVEQFRQQSGLLERREGETLVQQQISELNTELILAGSKRAEAEARLSQARRLLASGAVNVGASSEVINSALISSLIQQEAEVKRSVAQMGQELGRRHPRILSARAELEDLQRKIASEIDRIQQGLQSEVSVARAREAALRNSVQDLEARLAESNADQVQLRALERDSTAARTTLETFLQRFQEFNAQDDLASQRPNATILSAAAIPEKPSFPQRTLIVIAAVFVSALISIIVVLIVERLTNTGFQSAEQLEAFLDIPVIGSIPRLAVSSRRNKKSLEWHVLKHPHSAPSEALRSVYTKLLLKNQGEGSRVIQFASAEPDEGKSTIAIAIARSQGMLGRRVLLIDTDFRRSQVAKILGLRQSPGLIDLMSGTATFEDVLQVDPASGVNVIVAGEFGSVAYDLLASGKLRETVNAFRGSYEFVFADSPPILSLSDASLVANAVDQSILVVRWARTRRQVVRYAVNQLLSVDAHIGGLILSQVDIKKSSMYSYGDSGQYYGKYAKYYTKG